MKLRLGSRGSTLALWQARHVQSLLQSTHKDLSVDIEVLHTTGDRITDVPLAMIGDKGLFTKEVDNAVLDGRVSCAVHSFKDVPTRLTDGLVVAAVLEREDPRDAFLPAPGVSSRLRELPPRARVGTSSLRRRALLLHAHPDLVISDLRGNLDSRIDKVQRRQFDAIILALAGVRRLGREDLVGEALDPPDWLPAVGQGALAIVCRKDDAEARARLEPLDHLATRLATTAERSFLAALEGGCQIPIGALASVVRNELTLHGLVAATNGDSVVRGTVQGTAAHAASVGTQLAALLVTRGADAVLQEVRGRTGRDVPIPSAP